MWVLDPKKQGRKEDHWVRHSPEWIDFKANLISIVILNLQMKPFWMTFTRRYFPECLARIFWDVLPMQLVKATGPQCLRSDGFSCFVNEVYPSAVLINTRALDSGGFLRMEWPKCGNSLRFSYLDRDRRWNLYWGWGGGASLTCDLHKMG